MSVIPNARVEYTNDSGQGWLVRKDRKAKRDEIFTLTKEDTDILLDTIDKSQPYTKLSEKLEEIVKLRDKALISMSWIWFKRGNEILKVRLKDVKWDTNYLYVIFHIQKKVHHFKFCPNCVDKKGRPTKNASRAQFCNNCAQSLASVGLTSEGVKDNTVIKRKTLKYQPYCDNIIEWIKTIKSNYNTVDEDYIYPPIKLKTWVDNMPVFDFRCGHEEDKSNGNSVNRLTIQRFDELLHNLDPRMSSCMFRYGQAENNLTRYSAQQVKDMGDWESSAMPERYAKKKGLSQAEKLFADDVI